MVVKITNDRTVHGQPKETPTVMNYESLVTQSCFRAAVLSLESVAFCICRIKKGYYKKKTRLAGKEI